MNKCRLKTNNNESLYSLGRGKKFEFEYVGNKVRIFKKGIMHIMSEDEFKNNFEILNR